MAHPLMRKKRIIRIRFITDWIKSNSCMNLGLLSKFVIFILLTFMASNLFIPATPLRNCFKNHKSQIVNITILN